MGRFVANRPVFILVRTRKYGYFCWGFLGLDYLEGVLTRWLKTDNRAWNCFLLFGILHM